MTQLQKRVRLDRAHRSVAAVTALWTANKVQIAVETAQVADAATRATVNLIAP